MIHEERLTDLRWVLNPRDDRPILQQLWRIYSEGGEEPYTAHDEWRNVPTVAREYETDDPRHTR